MAAPLRRLAGRSGYTMIEVVVAVLLIAIIAGPMMSISLTGRMSGGRRLRRIEAAAAITQVSQALKQYVTADRTVANGPGAGVDGWLLPGDQSGLYALGAGRHTLNVGTYAPALAAFNAQMYYDVAVRTTPSGPQPDVTFSISWTEP